MKAPAWLALLALACGPPAVAPQAGQGYGEFRNPFPSDMAAEQPADEPATETPAQPAAPATAPPAPTPTAPTGGRKHCGELCGKCTRACEMCDTEQRTTGKWGPQCTEKDKICGALVDQKKSTGCACPGDD